MKMKIVTTVEINVRKKPICQLSMDCPDSQDNIGHQTQNEDKQNKKHNTETKNKKHNTETKNK